MSDIWVKVVLVISLDGRITAGKGSKAKLGGPGDRKVLEESLEWADAILMGGETLRIHQNTCLIHQKDLIEKRISEKRSNQPISIIISNKNDHPSDLPFFSEPINRWIITSKSNLKELHPNNGYKKLISLKEKWADTLSKIYEEGVEKLTVLGGARLVGSLLIEDQVNELQLTLTPKLIGGESSWIPNYIKNLPINFSNKNSWLLSKFELLEEDEIMLSYIRSNL